MIESFLLFFVTLKGMKEGFNAVALMHLARRPYSGLESNVESSNVARVTIWPYYFSILVNFHQMKMKLA